MGSQRPAGTRPATKPTTSTATHRPIVQDLGADTAIWHTRGLQTNSRMRTPPTQLPPSIVPRLMLWAVVIGVALIGYHFLKQVLH